MNATIRVARLAAILGVLGIPGCDDDIGMLAEPQAPPPVALVIHGGNNQIGGAGDALPVALEVRVTDSDGNGVAGQRVSWTVTSGRGFLLNGYSSSAHSLNSITSSDEGIAAMDFTPARLGTSTITASVPGRSIEPVTFSIEATVLVISNGFWGFYYMPDGSQDAEVPLGTPVEWVNITESMVEIEATAAPVGEETFSVLLAGGARFRLAPEVAGTWQWTYRYRNEEGGVLWDPEETRTLTVQPAS